MKTITRNITYYVAEGGTEFTTESKCEEYEKLLRLPEYYIVVDKRRAGDTKLFSTMEDAKKYADYEGSPINFASTHLYIYPVRLDQYKK